MSEPLQVLVVDDDRQMVKTLVDILRSQGFQASAAYSGEEALEIVKGDETFSCVLTDIKMPGLDGVALFRDLKALQPDLPVVLMTAFASDDLVQNGMNEGALTVLIKPLDLNLLIRFLTSLQSERLVYIVDDNTEFCKTLGDILRKRSFSVIEITEPSDLWGVLKTKDHEAVLLDMKLGEVNGLEVFREIRATYSKLPVILITGHKEEMESSIETALRLTAFACLYKPVQIEKLLSVLTEVYHRDLADILDEPPQQ